MLQITAPVLDSSCNLMGVVLSTLDAIKAANSAVKLVAHEIAAAHKVALAQAMLASLESDSVHPRMNGVFAIWILLLAVCRTSKFSLSASIVRMKT